MKLSEWIYIKHTTETAVDIFAQLMAHTYTHPEYALNPEMIDVSDEDENRYVNSHSAVTVLIMEYSTRS